MKESDLLNKILINLKPDCRMFRNNVGLAWIGRILSRKDDCVTLINPRPLHAGLCKGSSDLIGWTTVEITHDMVGKKVAVFTAIEAKTKNIKVTDEQTNFLKVVNESGGIGQIIYEDDVN